MNEIVKREHREVEFSQMERMAQAMANSKLFGVRNADEALGLMMLAQAEGQHPSTVARDYHVIQGRPALKADAMLARFQKAGGVIMWDEMSDARVAAFFSHPQSSPKPLLIDWTMERAKTAGLAGKDNWKKFPRQMLKARVISEGIRAVYPACNAGTYTYEEVQDMEPTKSAEVAMPKIKATTPKMIEATVSEPTPPKTPEVAPEPEKASTPAPEPEKPVAAEPASETVTFDAIVKYISDNGIPAVTVKDLLRAVTGNDKRLKDADPMQYPAILKKLKAFAELPK